ncbi:hypothetical protein C8R43DRAFT_972547 [Mycena crocata]|nr:hypothetical protein C8R43DRAFT_972547 [Mycena crocata]
MAEEIDNETLQAQIDLSMSFAQNLVSSWVKPARKSAKNSSRALEAELKDYMRRPPRLGVGAPIPEVASSSRETERLKSHLASKGKKRTRDDDADAVVPKQLSDNEEESRGATIKKKARIDPFEAHGKKKKKEAIELPKPPVHEQKPPVKQTPPVLVGSEDVLGASEPPSPTLSPSKRVKKKKHKNKDHATETDSLPGPSKGLPDENVVVVLSIPPSGEDFEPPTAEVVDISLITAASPTSPSHRLQSTMLKGPILNLNGPPTDDESAEEGEPDTPLASPKKKRRRRRKKKSLPGGQHSL